MEYTTYLFGAGASHNALPVVTEIAKAVGALIEEVRSSPPRMPEGDDTSKFVEDATAIKDACGLLESLKLIATEHPSLDTYARTLLFKKGGAESEALVEYKALVAFYFSVSQLFRPIDQRYELFLASVLEPRESWSAAPTIPGRVRLLFWNYDFQLEKAAWAFCNSAEEISACLDASGRVYRLNGSCLPNWKRTYMLDFINERNRTKALRDALQHYHDCTDFEEHRRGVARIIPGIKFAWETRDVPEQLTDIMENTGTLVVIGYSFPFFNREIDSRLFSAFVTGGEKKRILIQETDPERFNIVAARLARRLGTERAPQPTWLNDTGEFYVPD